MTSVQRKVGALGGVFIHKTSWAFNRIVYVLRSCMCVGIGIDSVDEEYAANPPVAASKVLNTRFCVLVV